jgi:hypothetical protein
MSSAAEAEVGTVNHNGMLIFLLELLSSGWGIHKDPLHFKPVITQLMDSFDKN